MTAAAEPPRAFLRRLAHEALLERGLWPAFGPDVAAEVAAAAPGPPAEPEARDLRAVAWASIDNVDSRDLDQLTASAPEGEATRVWVAIADVAGRVARGSAIDRHAENNTTSVYTAGGVFPMLPEELSTDRTSLVEGEDRRAVVSEILVGPAGELAPVGHYRAWVRNHARLVYEEVAAWLEGAGPMPAGVARVPGLEADLRRQDAAARRLRRHRDARGALELDRPEPRAVFDGERLAGLDVQPHDRARRLIEDLMIATNEATVRFLASRGWPSLRRVVREPRRWARLVEIARELGAGLPERPDVRALQAFLHARRRADPLRFPDLSLTVIKLIGSGEYVASAAGDAAPGHFGLAVADYAHSTAPNRRYPDLVTQRLVLSALDGAAPAYSLAELEDLAEHCTTQEDEAKAVERQNLKSAAALLLAPRLGERFEALVAGINTHGTWVRLLEPPVEGKLVRGGADLDVGDRLAVRLVAADAERGFVDFARA